MSKLILHSRIANRIDLKNNFTELTTKIKNCLNNEDDVMFVIKVLSQDKQCQNNLNEMLKELVNRYHKIINEYNKLYINRNEDEHFLLTETKATTLMKINTGDLSSSISCIVIPKKSVNETELQSERYFLLVVVAIFIFISLIILLYFDKIME